MKAAVIAVSATGQMLTARKSLYSREMPPGTGRAFRNGWPNRRSQPKKATSSLSTSTNSTRPRLAISSSPSKFNAGRIGRILVLFVLGLEGADADAILLGQDQAVHRNVFKHAALITVVLDQALVVHLSADGAQPLIVTSVSPDLWLALSLARSDGRRDATKRTALKRVLGICEDGFGK